jgi:putative FmdB family regulatory protein
MCSRFRVEAGVPTYDYECKKCRHRFEEVQPFSSEPVATCPNCGGRAARQFTVPVVVYKGSGFYTTDNGRSSSHSRSSPPSKDSEGGAPSAPEKKEPAKTSAPADGHDD